MARRLWLLVEWMEDNDLFPSYGIVNVDSYAYRDSDLNPGKEILISVKRNEPRHAKIITISENKQNVQERQEFLKRQDNNMKNVFEVCMLTLKKLKSPEYYQNSVQSDVTSMNLPHIISANEDDDDSDDDSDQTMTSVYQPNTRVKYIQPSHSLQQRVESERQSRHTYTPSTSQRLPSMGTSTPLPSTKVQRKKPLSFNQGSQTDGSLLQPPIEKIEEMEAVLLDLHQQFIAISAKMDVSNVTIDRDDGDDDSNVVEEINNSWMDESVEENSINNTHQHNATSEVTVDSTNSNVEKKAKINAEGEKHYPVKDSQVRRMSAQSTNFLDMVPIGDGNAKVPARLLNDIIDWQSYTTATRQLLQSIFPRKVLATHSLTGKQSPAHQNKPPKKILDPNLVNDIVKTVSARCGVPKNLVRNCITVKCTDEAKLYRNRQNNRKQKYHQRDENVTPSRTPSSD